MAGNFRAGGLATGMDTNAIVDQLVALRRTPIDKLVAKQRAVDVKVSALSSLASKLEAFETAVKNLAEKGARGVMASQVPSQVSVATTSASLPGRFSLEVGTLATAAKARSAAFASGQTVTGGTLQIGADGDSFDITVPDGASLATVAGLINDSEAPVTASVVNDGTNSYLVMTRDETGYELGSLPSSALSFTEASTGALGQALGLSVTTPATNASFTLDGLPVTRRSNEVTDALPGTTLTLLSQTTSAQTLILGEDSTKTKENLQTVVTSYNDILKSIQSELNLAANIDRSKTLGGEPVLRMLQSRLQGVITKTVGTGTIKTLADLGVKSDRTGQLSIDDTAFQRAIKSDGLAVDKLFDNGLKASVVDLVDVFTDSVDGAITSRKKGLADEKKRIEASVSALEIRVESYKEMLIAQFAAMEKAVSSFKATGNFLTSQSQQQNKE